ncbi:MAG TPA: hypothetical protein VFD32_07280 [Dehalococcoidia bacterium]|nr:hypothetical protein [Dehalococcoidia bacterium]
MPRWWLFYPVSVPFVLSGIALWRAQLAYVRRLHALRHTGQPELRHVGPIEVVVDSGFWERGLVWRRQEEPELERLRRRMLRWFVIALALLPLTLAATAILQRWP